MQECVDHINTYKDKGRANHAMMLCGHGDGGGGVDREMMERLNRLTTYSSSTAVPHVVLSTPTIVFDEVRRVRNVNALEQKFSVGEMQRKSAALARRAIFGAAQWCVK